MSADRDEWADCRLQKVSKIYGICLITMYLRLNLISDLNKDECLVPSNL